MTEQNKLCTHNMCRLSAEIGQVLVLPMSVASQEGSWFMQLNQAEKVLALAGCYSSSGSISSLPCFAHVALFCR
eukprot:9102136-Lingulodinium_polyedra.AAC.1